MPTDIAPFNMHLVISQGVSVLIEIGADVNAGEVGDTPLCIAVKSNNKKMVEALLQHNIANVNIREALKFSWELKFDAITGLLLEHIAVDRSRDSVNLSGLELTTLKPPWILPSLGLKTLPEKRLRKHRKQGSLGHVKDLMRRRKSVSTEAPFDLEVDALESMHSRDSRRKSVDMSALKYVPDEFSVSMENADSGGYGGRLGRRGVEDTDSGGYGGRLGRRGVEDTGSGGYGGRLGRRGVEDTDSGGYGRLRRRSEEEYTVTNSLARSRSINCDQEDSGVETIGVVHRSNPLHKRADPLHKRAGIMFGVMPRGSVRRQEERGTVSGASTLPHSTLDQYTLNNVESLNSTQTSHHDYSDPNITLSPSQLFKKLRKHRRKSNKGSLHESSSSNFSAGTDSPLPVIYYQQEDMPVLSPDGSFSSSARVDDSFTSTPSSLWSPNSSNSSTPYTTSVEVSSSSATEEVDFVGCETIPEEPSFEEEHLIKNLDLSSNKLCNFDDLLTERDLVFKRLKDVKTLDLKQNCFSELLPLMMKVRMLLNFLFSAVMKYVFS